MVGIWALILTSFRLADAVVDCEKKSADDIEEHLIAKLSLTPKKDRSTPKADSTRSRAGHPRTNLSGRFEAVATENDGKCSDVFSVKFKRIVVGKMWLGLTSESTCPPTSPS